jgi:hypothetical protein
MSIILKLIGNATDYILECPDDTFSLESIYNHFISKGIKEEYLNQIKFLINGCHISDLNKTYSATSFSRTINSVPNQIFLYTQDINIKTHLSQYIFNSTETIIENISPKEPLNISLSSESEEEIFKPTSPTPIDSINILENEELNKINQMIIKQFEDPDFTNLLRIVITKPNLLSLASSYLMNGTICEKIEVSSIDDFKYNEEYLQLEKLGFVRLNVDLIKSIINHFEGHLNMCIRYILWYEAQMELLL